MQLDAVRRQLAFLKEEYAGKQTLLDKGLIRKTEIKSIQRAMADADGQIGRLAAEISETGSQIVKFEQQIVQTEDAYRQAALDEFRAWRPNWMPFVNSRKRRKTCFVA